MSERLGLFTSSTIDFAVIHTTLDGIIEEWAGASERVLGYNRDEAVGMSLSQLFTADDKRLGLDVNEIALAVSAGRSEDDRWHVRKDGSRFWASGVLTLVCDASGREVGLCKVLRDKTDVRTQIQLFENLTVRLKADLETNRKTVSALAHELRNPLMPIVSALELLQRPDPTGTIALKVGKVLSNQVAVLVRLVDDLNLLGVESAQVPRLAVERIDLNAVLTETVDSLREFSNLKTQLLTLVVPVEQIELMADPARLQQMLLNLLNNALKYTPAGGCVHISATVEADMAVVRVEDNGVGIAPDVLPRIFDLFTREGRQPEIEGKGVGLTVVRQLAAAHGGLIDARSPGLDKGAVFTLRLPRLVQ